MIIPLLYLISPDWKGGTPLQGVPELLFEILWVENKMTLVVCLGSPKDGCLFGFLKNREIMFIRTHPHEVYYEKHPAFGWMFFIVYFLRVGGGAAYTEKVVLENIHPSGECFPALFLFVGALPGLKYISVETWLINILCLGEILIKTPALNTLT